jgi:hypothetical protein
LLRGCSDGESDCEQGESEGGDDTRGRFHG